MKLETIKSIILITLIILSLLLTLGIWRYQPDYEYADSSRRVIEANLGGEEETRKSVITPAQIIYHIEGSHLGLIDKSKERQLFEMMQGWALYDFSSSTIDLNENNFNRDDTVEVIFPTEIPTNIIEDLFTINEESYILSSSFNRMYIDLNDEITENQLIFHNTENGFTISANIQNMAEEREELLNYRFENGFEFYVDYENATSDYIYLPEEVEMYKRPFSYQTIPITPLRNVLFTSPSAVRNSEYTDGSRLYTDGSRAMIVYDHHMEYTNPTPSETTPLEAKQLISQSLDFINAHGGWTTDVNDQYVLYKMNQRTNTVNFQLTYGGYPVFEEDELSTISVTMQNQSIYQYNRPLIQLKDTFGEGQQEKLESGAEIVTILERDKQYESKAILDVKLGYKIEKQEDGQIFVLTPTWYIKDYSGWQELESDQEIPVSRGGEK
ncbi:YycH family regulatory protein [Aquibacillus albus]|uniref:Regulatory protein YycH of two-component signal transduction system YycFG n=1 Tax=Aquibacillus albus TaxID=1168171 RepID=A0ABS2N338_9BACI|nr:two-component system activity regulator YycH [Aquibacillus albus]MBM7572546.1 regulatory protein YycH of two-component signal transduction system YycFG [Aquibacillus albus]